MTAKLPSSNSTLQDSNTVLHKCLPTQRDPNITSKNNQISPYLNYRQFPWLRDNNPWIQSRSPFFPGLTSPRMNFSTSSPPSPEFSPSSNIDEDTSADLRFRFRPPRLVAWVGILWLSPRIVFEFKGLSARAEGRGRRRGLAGASPGSQFSLSESPEGDLISPSFSLSAIISWALLVYCNLARLDCALPNFGFFPFLLGSCWDLVMFRLVELVFRAVLLVDRMRLIAATADPFDSRSAWAVSSSLTSPSARICHVRASRERPLPSDGTNGEIDELLAWVGYGSALWLRSNVLILFCGTNTSEEEEDGRGSWARGGEGDTDTSSALPSRDIDNLTFGEEVVRSSLPPHDVGFIDWELQLKSAKNMLA